jgi:hypothetical protein
VSIRGQDIKALSDRLATLEGIDQVTRLRFPHGQVLMYQTHLPPGAFVFLSGSLKLEDTEARGAHKPTARVLARADRPVVLPPVDELDMPVGVTVHLESDAEVLFIPRTLLHSRPEIGKLLELAELHSHSLQSITASTWETR